MTEFEIIRHYFAAQTIRRADVLHGIGDDAAVVKVPPQHDLVVTTDTLVAGRHFPLETLPCDIGHKALAVNLSDLAAMGSNPAWVSLALTLPQEDHHWLQSFCDGFFSLAARYNIELIGGDTTCGPLTITIQALGLTPEKKALRRFTAEPGDLIYVTGTVGDAGLALTIADHQKSFTTADYAELMQRLNRPTPRIDIGLAIRAFAHAAIDISDGLAADLNHILVQSNVGAKVCVDQIPLSPILKNTLSPEAAIALALTAGDDYELCFTIPQTAQKQLAEALANSSCPYTCIGMITAEPGLHLHDQNGHVYHGPQHGYRHF